jgi:hypothetical protein
MQILLSGYMGELTLGTKTIIPGANEVTEEELALLQETEEIMILVDGGVLEVASIRQWERVIPLVFTADLLVKVEAAAPRIAEVQRLVQAQHHALGGFELVARGVPFPMMRGLAIAQDFACKRELGHVNLRKVTVPR